MFSHLDQESGSLESGDDHLDIGSPEYLQRACRAFLDAHTTVMAIGTEQTGDDPKLNMHNISLINSAYQRRDTALLVIRHTPAKNINGLKAKIEVLFALEDWLDIEDSTVGVLAFEIVREIMFLCSSDTINYFHSSPNILGSLQSRTQWLDRLRGFTRARNSKG